MNKKQILTACMMTGTLLTGPSAFADEHKHGYFSCLSDKISQGFFNTTTGFIELPKNIINISHDQNIFVGLTWGTVRGVAHAVGRTVVGAAELVTSPIPTDDYISPPYVWDRFSEDTRYFGLNLPGFWTTYGPLDDGD
ncbi:exosortase system-associated protein, TIGR04073 family [Methylicorpusculum sp.]|uniref:exosortase system-associated protein, TIGR04073 family n=1 Tax=Methylicorpusculum sp. TaxID=2713644 RepID=UPI00272FF4E5|nr:exosortase system-associated protein, TIGR04073 family [Methylicorpusculum sp.]MDP2180419.1 exosortase system-associated protein, TIGR04073 family [Methylicorpusculum sp.]MDP3530818.1 exosortase system-associated protein, TIGR04073 family [Methylicorpusculum sp.]MDZ4151248.1 exosortase system-associated protein, TIGR04073 family [Methylicorpusculum sp.]